VINANKIRALILLLSIVVGIGGAALAAGEAENLAPKSGISSSSLPNPVWSAVKVVDGSIGPADGWLGEWEPGKAEQPWISFTLPTRTMVTGIDLIQASLEQAGKNRFSRPKKIFIDFGDGEKTQRLAFELRDLESEFQKLKFAPLPADTVTITIDDVYPDAKIGNMTGFQEVKIYGNGIGGGSDSSGVTPYSPPARAPQGAPESILPGKGSKPSVITEPGSDSQAPIYMGSDGSDTGGGVSKGRLTPDEQEIIDMLKLIIEKLEKKFLED